MRLGQLHRHRARLRLPLHPRRPHLVRVRVRVRLATNLTRTLTLTLTLTLALTLTRLYLTLRAYLSPPAKERYKNNPILARYKARIGFTCGKYEAAFWFYELLEMTRKTGLMAHP